MDARARPACRCAGSNSSNATETIRAIRLLTENRARLDGIAGALLRDETLEQAQAYAAAGLPPPRAARTASDEAAATVPV
jgi:hypothetical protein